MIIGPDKKMIRLINDVNQELKTIYTNYTIHHSQGLVSGDKSDCVLKTGIHVCKLSNMLTHPISEYLSDKAYILSSRAIYDLIKDNKKLIDSVNLERGGHISFNDIDGIDTTIGRVVGEVLDEDKKTYATRHNTAYDIVTSFDGLPLSASDVLALTKNKVVNVGYGEFKSRITKELLPGLKKTHTVDVMFTDVSDTMFDMTFRVVREYVISYHRYSCVKLQ